MITLSNVSKSFGERVLFEAVSLQLTAGHRYGLVGANGSGKSTLMAMLAGKEPASDGEIIVPNQVRIGVLEQDRYLSDAQRIVDVAMMGDRVAFGALQDKEQLLAQAQPDAHAIAEAEERVQHADGYTLQARAGAILEGLGIAAPVHGRPLAILSGGFKLRVLLAQTLVGRPDLLLLDEPTNHLDILTIRWLEEFLAAYGGCAVVISHDHRFLDNVATHILDVDYETITLYPGNYSRFVADKLVTRERKEAEIERQRQIVAEKKAFIERFRAKNTKARQAQSRVKQIEKIEIDVLPQTSRRAPLLRFEIERPSGREVLGVDGVSKSFGEHVVLSNVSLTVRRNERVAVIGANGLGKSTLLKILVNALPCDTGQVTWGYETNVGYFAQDHRELLTDPKTTVLDYLWEICPQEGTSFVRGQLGRLLFSGEDVEKKTSSLSGGEAARLIFSRLIVQKPNVLVLDEPTNHLDLESIEALAEALEHYEGTVIFVSHDRWLVSRLASRIIELTPDSMVDYPGSYEDYLSREGQDHLDTDTVLARAKRERAEKNAGDNGAPNDWEEQKRLRSLKRKLVARRDELTASIEVAEARLATIRERYCAPGFFDGTAPDEVTALQREEAELGPHIETLMSEWEQVELQLEELGEGQGA
jgi:ATPase subunit of ABC transporter with duplicated ATPase domains